MKKVVAFILMVIMLFSTAYAETYYCFADEVNLRRTPSTEYSRLGYLVFGDEIDIDYIKGDWAYSSTYMTEELGCWVSLSWLSLYEPERVDNEEYVVIDRRVNVRKTPNGKQIKRVGRGHVMVVDLFIADSEGVWWARTNEGWIMYDFLEKKED